MCWERNITCIQHAVEKIIRNQFDGALPLRVADYNKYILTVAVNTMQSLNTSMQWQFLHVTWLILELVFFFFLNDVTMGYFLSYSKWFTDWIKLCNHTEEHRKLIWHEVLGSSKTLISHSPNLISDTERVIHLSHWVYVKNFRCTCCREKKKKHRIYHNNIACLGVGETFYASNVTVKICILEVQQRNADISSKFEITVSPDNFTSQKFSRFLWFLGGRENMWMQICK